MCEALPSKKCFKCGEVKVLSDFYKHPMMADGHVNKCKECNKKDVHKNRADNIDYVREYDRARRKKENVTEERWEELSTNRREYAEAYYEANPDKYEAKLARQRKANVMDAEWEEYLAAGRKEAFTPEEWEKRAAKKKEWEARYWAGRQEERAEATRKYREANPKKYKAHSKVGYAVKAGKLLPQPCEVCGESSVHAHHCDYDKPLDVLWLCPEHHREWHRIHGEGANA